MELKIVFKERNKILSFQISPGEVWRQLAVKWDTFNKHTSEETEFFARREFSRPANLVVLN
jgi:hypothetical protein